MLNWEGLPFLQSSDELISLAKLIEAKEIEVVMEIGSPNAGLAYFLTLLPVRVRTTYLIPKARIDSKSFHRPSKLAAEVLKKKRVLVYLTEPTPNAAFAWASALQPGSVLVARCVEGHDNWPNFNYVSCKSLHEPYLNHSLVVERIEASKTAPPEKPATHQRPRRPLRSVFLGDLSYCSAYRLGITQGMSLLGAWHRDVNIRDNFSKIDKQVSEMKPDLVFTHMLLWPPVNTTPVYELLNLVESWRRKWGTAVVIHDGDPRPNTRFPHNVSDAVDLVLLNHTRPVPEWSVQTLHWPYAAFTQAQIGLPVPELKAKLVFTGLLREDGLYGPRTQCVRDLQNRISMRLFPEENGVNNRMQVADVVASCDAVVGFGRPEAPGWIDTRVFSIPGAGGVLIHDDVGGILEPDVHYLPCERYNADSVVEAYKRALEKGTEIRRNAFEFVQAHHTYKHRCEQVVNLLFE